MLQEFVVQPQPLLRSDNRAQHNGCLNGTEQIVASCKTNLSWAARTPFWGGGVRRCAVCLSQGCRLRAGHVARGKQLHHQIVAHGTIIM